jgi:hypothetical protein
MRLHTDNQVAKRCDRDRVNLSLGMKDLRQKIGQYPEREQDIKKLKSELRPR